MAEEKEEVKDGEEEKPKKKKAKKEKKKKATKKKKIRRKVAKKKPAAKKKAALWRPFTIPARVRRSGPRPASGRRLRSSYKTISAGNRARPAWRSPRRRTGAAPRAAGLR